MPDLLLELFSEEIPARMQRKAAEDLRKLVTDALVERGFLYEGAKAFATPRRLALHIAGLPLKGQDIIEEKKGPRIDAPPAAIQGFLKSAGLNDVSQATIVDDPKKGSFYISKAVKPGRLTIEVLAEIIPDVIRSFPWPKSMRWGAASREPGSLKWVRPLQSILCTFGPETEEPEIVHFEIGGISSSNVTYGHRFHAPAAITVRRFDDYVSSLEKAHVILDADRRKDIILHDAKNLAFAQGLELIEDEGLLEEVAGLVEWPMVLMGQFDEAFLSIAPEVIRATIRANQKCFVVRAGGTLANRFILTANIAASDGGLQIIAGNERVVRARLSDARHFWETDRANLPDLAGLEASATALGLDLAKPLDQRMAKLDKLGVVFHQKLGSQGERVKRIVALARELAPIVGQFLPEAERKGLPELAARAALLAKADLTSEMVGEFPELQGLIGRYYATLQGEHPSVCAAIEEHYKPLGPTDRVPTDPVSVTVALADKLDTLVGFWAIDEKPTGSKDPYALRRAALGVIRLVLKNGVRLRTSKMPSYKILEPNEDDFIYSKNENIDPLDMSHIDFSSIIENFSNEYFDKINEEDLETIIFFAQQHFEKAYYNQGNELKNKYRVVIENPYLDFVNPHSDLLSFFHDRLKVQLREQGVRHDLVEAVLNSPVMFGLVPAIHGLGAQGIDVGGRDKPDHDGALTASDDLVLIVARVHALTAFLATEDGVNLVAGTKRAVKFVEQAEKVDGAGQFEAAPDAALYVEAEEKSLGTALDAALPVVTHAIAAEDYAAAMAALAALRAPVDAFAEKVLVNADDTAIRFNRLRLLAQLRRATRMVADFGKIAG